MYSLCVLETDCPDVDVREDEQNTELELEAGVNNCEENRILYPVYIYKNTFRRLSTSNLPDLI